MEKSIYFSVDRFEGEHVVLEDDKGKSQAVLKTLFPNEVTRGSVVYLGEDGKYHLDSEKTRLQKEEAISLQNKLLNKKKHEKSS